MKENLIKILENAFTDESVESISKHVGITPKQTKDGIDGIVPTVLSSLLGHNEPDGKTPIWFDKVNKLFKDDNNVIKTDRLNLTEVTNKGNVLVNELFGNKLESISSSISQSVGIEKNETDGLLATVVPLTLGHLSAWMKKNSWNFGNLMNNLSDSKTDLLAALPVGLSASKLFAPVVAPVDKPIAAPVQTPAEPAVETFIKKDKEVPPTKVEEKKSNRWLNWLLWIILIALVLWLVFRSCNKEENVDPLMTVDSTELVSDNIDDGNTPVIYGTLNEDGDWVYEVGENVDLNLPDGTVLVVGDKSVEYRLVEFINSDKLVDNDTWFTLDRFYFELESANLKSHSEKQLKNIAAIMKAYPDIELKIGGFTDNTGSKEFNAKLSNDRAHAALSLLVDLGVNKDRIEAEGYGEQLPVASNETEEGRAQNRRVDLLVTKK